ncbi:MAG: hypoxanthine phosphoribosyltransferase [Gemmatimonadota bacterium]|jgi:hypoxanthine phosphoribosyltransferase
MPDRASGAVPLAAPAWLARTGGRELRSIVFPAEEIERRVGEMAASITAHYPPGEELLVLGLLKGSFIFLSDLVRQIERPLHVDFIVVSSYGTGTTTSGDVKLLYDPTAPIRDRHILLVEDIVDSGNTVNRLAEALRTRKPASLELCALLHKRLAPHLSLEPRWVGFDAPADFLVGYGLDHAEDFRHLPFVASIDG